MSNAQSDAAFSPVDKIMLIEQVDHVKTYEHFLTMPWQRNGMRDRGIVNGIGILVGGVRFRSGLCRPQPGPIEHLSREHRALP